MKRIRPPYHYYGAGTAASAPRTKIESQTSDRSQVVHLKTALNHLTVIELREPVIQVATGSQSFKVEWRENKVFVQPTEPDASTNLFIWTASQRLNYELEPAGAVTSMDFAVDQIPVQVTQPKPASATPPQPSPTEVLLAGKPVRLESASPPGSRLKLLFAISMRGTAACWSGTPSEPGHSRLRREHPQGVCVTGARYPQSLYSLVDSQLGDREAARLTSSKRLPCQYSKGTCSLPILRPDRNPWVSWRYACRRARNQPCCVFNLRTTNRSKSRPFLVR